MGFILYITAIILFFVLTLINYIFVGNKKGYFRNTALHLDIFGNMEFRTLFNSILIHPKGYQFGKQGETISSVLGKNQLLGALTQVGKSVVWALNIIQKDHCLKSINNNI